MFKKIAVFVVALCLVFVSVVSVSAAANYVVLSLGDYSSDSHTTMTHRYSNVNIPASQCSIGLKTDSGNEYRYDDDVLSGSVDVPKGSTLSLQILTPAVFKGENRYYMSVDGLDGIVPFSSDLDYSLVFSQPCKYNLSVFSRITWYDSNYKRVGSLSQISRNNFSDLENSSFSGSLSSNGSKYTSVDVPSNAKYFCVDYVVRLTDLEYSGTDLNVSYAFDDWSFTYGSEDGIAIVGSLLTTVIGWVATVVNAFLAPDGSLNSLLPLLAIFVAVPAMLFGVRAIRYFIWGA